MISINRLLSSLCFCLFLFSCASSPKEKGGAANEEPAVDSIIIPLEESTLEKAQRIHKAVLSIDTHNDIDVRDFTAERNYSQDIHTQVNIPKMEKGGLDVSFLVVYTKQGPLDASGYRRAYENAEAKFRAIHRLTEEYAPDKVGLALSSEEARRLVKSGKKAILIGMENGYPMAEDLSRLQEFYDQGARYMSLAHNGHSQLADSHTGGKDKVWAYNGLSPLGKKAVAELNRLGIMIDLSHPSKKANLEVLKLSKVPVIASHSGAKALNNVSRNMDNETLQVLKENGGVIQAVAVDEFIDYSKTQTYRTVFKRIETQEAGKMGLRLLTENQIKSLNNEDQEAYYEKYDSLLERIQSKKERGEITLPPPVDVKDFVDHIDYLVQLIGIDHVGISSDFDGGGGIEGWQDASETFNITLELVDRGYSEEEIKKLWGENLLRVMEEAEHYAAEQRKKSDT